MVHTGMVRSFSPETRQGVITCDLGGDVHFSAEHVHCKKLPQTGYMVEFKYDESAAGMWAMDIRFL